MTLCGSGRATSPRSWLLNDNAEDPSVYSHERDEDGNVAGENVPCDSILCPVELEKMDESAGHPIWRLTAPTYNNQHNQQQQQI